MSDIRERVIAFAIVGGYFAFAGLAAIGADTFVREAFSFRQELSDVIGAAAFVAALMFPQLLVLADHYNADDRVGICGVRQRPIGPFIWSRLQHQRCKLTEANRRGRWGDAKSKIFANASPPESRQHFDVCTAGRI